MIVSHSNDPSQSNVAVGDEQDVNPADSTDDVDLQLYRLTMTSELLMMALTLMIMDVQTR